MSFSRPPSHGSFIFSLNVSYFFILTALLFIFILFSFRRSVSCAVAWLFLPTVMPWLFTVVVSFGVVSGSFCLDACCAQRQRQAVAASAVESILFMFFCFLFGITKIYENAVCSKRTM